MEARFIQNLFLLSKQVKTVSYKDKLSALEKMKAAAIPSAGQKCQKNLFCVYGIELCCLIEHMQNQRDVINKNDILSLLQRRRENRLLVKHCNHLSLLRILRLSQRQRIRINSGSPNDDQVAAAF